eukprot:CAMPEP_0173095230 /NCGR_PEP_ID=MMETSP1102-20130122/31723_1 /TAXON_ID=49646 /ORGANISM="Geminigera sp., Strain Caron Lab Isolate" /LENGTH=279 /DNA_ID=CAMNT_0013984919 /DNA_START=202 /DNA_END=1038 /DNA_ORIENTATION=-
MGRRSKSPDRSWSVTAGRRSTPPPAKKTLKGSAKKTERGREAEYSKSERKLSTRVSGDCFMRSLSPPPAAVLKREREARAVAKLKSFAKVAAAEERSMSKSMSRMSKSVPAEYMEDKVAILQESQNSMLSVALSNWALMQEEVETQAAETRALVECHAQKKPLQEKQRASGFNNTECGDEQTDHSHILSLEHRVASMTLQVLELEQQLATAHTHPEQQRTERADSPRQFALSQNLSATESHKHDEQVLHFLSRSPHRKPPGHDIIHDSTDDLARDRVME